ncbi:hypothetical protein [Pontibacter roseus]|uniref:hypothetical protein n=1 Tax=Pontibacter roseus TaxID=336989 RepID=UPI000377F780|nr:hypothetical protein [Pontibacter roseus]
MRNLRVLNSVVLGAFGFSLVLLAYLFFAHELRYSPYQQGYLSNDFIFRFSAFWFISFLLTILVYLLNLSLNYLRLPRAEKDVAMLAGKLIFGAGLFGAVVVMVLFSFLS